MMRVFLYATYHLQIKTTGHAFSSHTAFGSRFAYVNRLLLAPNCLMAGFEQMQGLRGS
jgi:hypothetical protein